MGYEFQRDIMIVSTSLIGSYMIVRTASLVFGGFPNELNFNRNISTKTLYSMPWSMYVYFALIVILFIVGVVYQSSRRHQSLDNVILNEDLLGVIKTTENELGKD